VATAHEFGNYLVHFRYGDDLEVPRTLSSAILLSYLPPSFTGMLDGQRAVISGGCTPVLVGPARPGYANWVVRAFYLLQSYAYSSYLAEVGLFESFGGHTKSLAMERKRISA
jgi:hypothetical protein